MNHANSKPLKLFILFLAFSIPLVAHPARGSTQFCDSFRQSRSVAEIVEVGRKYFRSFGFNRHKVWPRDYHLSALPNEARKVDWGTPLKGSSPSRWSGNYGRKSHPFDKAMGGHEGEDLTDSYHVLAPANGLVVFAKSNCSETGRDLTCGAGYGNQLIIRHDRVDGNPSQILTKLAHLAPRSLSVRQGQRVNKGQFLAEMGTSGWSDGDHLHFEVGLHQGTYPNCPLPFNGGVMSPKAALMSTTTGTSSSSKPQTARVVVASEKYVLRTRVANLSELRSLETCTLQRNQVFSYNGIKRVGSHYLRVQIDTAPACRNSTARFQSGSTAFLYFPQRSSELVFH